MVVKSPFFAPKTPMGEQQTPGGTKHAVKKEVEEHKSGYFGTVANLMNAIVGSGIVGIPFAIREAGFVAGIFLIIIAAFITEKSLRLLIATAKHVHVPSYETLAEAAFGKLGFKFLCCNMFVMAFGAQISYLMVVKDTFSGIFLGEAATIASKRAVLLLVSLSIMVPLSSQRDMADLAKTSRVSVLIDVILVGLVVYSAPIVQSLQTLREENDGAPIASILMKDTIRPESIFVGLGVLSFAYVCQQSAFIIAGSLERPTLKRWSVVTATALTLCCFLELAMGASGYLAYGTLTEGNIINNLDPSLWSANIARCLLGTTMLLVYPLESFVSRHVCVVLFFSGRRAHEGDDSSILNRRDRRIGLTVMLYVMAVIPAAIFQNMGNILSITGSVGGSCLSYIGPGLVYLGIHGGRFIELVEGSWLGNMLPEALKTGALKESHDGLNAVETTPLVAGGVAADEADEQPDPDESQLQESFVRRLLMFIVWYLGGFPIWISIAQIGKRNLTNHIHDLALKSPHPIRIGDVVYTGTELSDLKRASRGAGDVSILKAVTRSESLPLITSESGTDLSQLGRQSVVLANASGGDINKRIGQELLQKKSNQAIASEEADPQQAPPTWYDFFVAIFFILFGVLAFTAGIISLVIQNKNE
ncbi:hypothetical protein MPSEU_001048700 [Mayamaea pseudoterrestris]|nr:hypothetical protein MPSEU_001048700 [Mayamaea pseudoterrestris]